MNCPVDGTELRMTERQGVEIDYCPKCRGVWLDRGELDKLIERSGAAPGYEREDEERRYDRGAPPEAYKHKKREGFLERIFDFD